VRESVGWLLFVVLVMTTMPVLAAARDTGRPEPTKHPPATEKLGIASQEPTADVPKTPDLPTRSIAENAVSKDETPLSINLLATDLAATWDHFSAKEDIQVSDVWKIVIVGEEKQLVCFGEPKGFLFTKQKYSNFVLTFEWKFVSNPDANSGVLVFTQNEPRLWPTSIQVQLHQPQAGAMFPSGDATSDNITEATGLAQPIGEWNTCKIVSMDGQLSVEVNERNAGKISGCRPARGHLALQSEGTETHFRRLLLKPLPDSSSATQPDPLASPEVPSSSKSGPLQTSPNAAG
jgi:hypothetical protein